MLNQSEPNVILTAHATKVNRPEPNWTEPQTCLAGRNHAFNPSLSKTPDGQSPGRKKEARFKSPCIPVRG